MSYPNGMKSIIVFSSPSSSASPVNTVLYLIELQFNVLDNDDDDDDDDLSISWSLRILCVGSRKNQALRISSINAWWCSTEGRLIFQCSKSWLWWLKISARACNEASLVGSWPVAIAILRRRWILAVRTNHAKIQAPRITYCQTLNQDLNRSLSPSFSAAANNMKRGWTCGSKCPNSDGSGLHLEAQFGLVDYWMTTCPTIAAFSSSHSGS